MSNDDGFRLDMVSSDDFRSKFNALVWQQGLTLDKACDLARVDYGQIVRAIEQGTYGLGQSEQILQRVLAIYGRDLSWLLTSTVDEIHSEDDQRLALFELCFQYALRAELDKETRGELIRRATRKLDSQPKDSRRLAARTGIPRTMKDLAYLHKQINRDRGR